MENTEINAGKLEGFAEVFASAKEEQKKEGG